MSRIKTVQSSGRKKTRRSILTACMFIGPHLIGFLLFSIVPILIAFIISFYKADGFGNYDFYRFTNFIKLVGDQRFLKSLVNTVIFTITSVPLTILFAFALALLLNNIGSKHISNTFRSMLFFPNISSVVATILVWKMLFNPNEGPINYILNAIGIQNPPRWTASSEWALVVIIIFCVWWGAGYYMVILLAGLKSIPTHLYEAAIIDGASDWQKLSRITIPLLSPTLFFVLIICIINAFKVFDPVFLMTRGGPGFSSSVLGYFIYHQGFMLHKMGYASAGSLFLFFLVLSITATQFWLQKKWVIYLEEQ